MPAFAGWQRSQGGVQFPTGGICRPLQEPASARLPPSGGGRGPPRDFHDHAEHQLFFREHFIKKGTEAAQACLQTLGSLANIPARGG